MKSFIAPTYTFTPGLSGAGTVNLSGISGFNVKYLVSIINQTRGEVIYSTASTSLRYTSVTGTTVTLFKDTSAMSAGDVLQVIYDDPANTVSTGLSQPLTDAQLRAAAVPVSGTVSTGLSQPLTDAQLRASSVPVSTGLTQPLTDTQLRATAVPVSGPLTDTQLRASAVTTSPNVTRGGGAIDANTQRVTLATDGPGVANLQIIANNTDTTKGSGVIDSKTQRVVVASDQTLPISSSVLTSIDTKTPALDTGSVPSLLKLSKRDGTQVTGLASENNSVSVGSYNQKFRDLFASSAPDTTIWDQSWTNQGSGFVSTGGNSSGSSYLKISACPIVSGSEYVLTSKRSFKLPNRFTFGLSTSQRIDGQEIEVSLVGVDGSGNVETITATSDLTISGTITVATNVATINFATNHGLNGGDRVVLLNNTDSRINSGPSVVTVVTEKQITVPLTLANGTYTAGGIVRIADPVNYARNAASMFLETTTATAASFVVRRNGAKFKTSSVTLGTTTANQSNTSPFTDAFTPANEYEILSTVEDLALISRPFDSISAASYQRYNTYVPDEDKDYKVRVRVKNNDTMSLPVARITAISKTGTTTSTVTTDVAHGLTTSDYVTIYGVRDQTNFANSTAQAVVASVISPTQFTVVFGIAATASSAGGVVYRVKGSILPSSINSSVVQSISRTDNVMSIVGTATWLTTVLPGETIHLYGCDATSMGLYDGSYKVLRTNSFTLFVESVGANFTSINCGGSVIKRTDVRLHFMRPSEYSRMTVDLATARGPIDLAKAQTVVGTVAVSTLQTLSTVNSVTSSNAGIPLQVADISSAAITTTTTTAATTLTGGSAYSIQCAVTAVSGTNPTFDLSIEESSDTATNWTKVYDFPRITANGVYKSPVIEFRGNRVRYVQTIGGTTPSFTRQIIRLQSNANGSYYIQNISRTIDPNTLNSTSASIECQNSTNFYVTVRCTAQTTPATIALQFSDDNTNWFTSTTTVATVNGIASAKVQNEIWRFARLIVSAAGSGITLDTATIKGVGQ